MNTHTDVPTWFNYGSTSSLVSSRQTFLHRVLIESAEKPHFEFTNQAMHHLFAVYSTVTQITKLVILVSIHNAACFLKLVHNTSSYTHSYPHTKNLSMNKHIALTHVTITMVHAACLNSCTCIADQRNYFITYTIALYSNYAHACIVQNTTFVILIYNFYVCFFKNNQQFIQLCSTIASTFFSYSFLFS